MNASGRGYRGNSAQRGAYGGGYRGYNRTGQHNGYDARGGRYHRNRYYYSDGFGYGYPYGYGGFGYPFYYGDGGAYGSYGYPSDYDDGQYYEGGYPRGGVYLAERTRRYRSRASVHYRRRATSSSSRASLRP